MSFLQRLFPPSLPKIPEMCRIIVEIKIDPIRIVQEKPEDQVPNLQRNTRLLAEAEVVAWNSDGISSFGKIATVPDVQLGKDA